VLEGEIVPPEVESVMEGPFGEWTGYYASGARPEPLFRVKAILHRNDPILHGNPPTFAYNSTLGSSLRRAAALWDDLDNQIPGVKGVWMLEEGRISQITVISIEQGYSGHARQAALIAAGSKASAYFIRWIIVVDDDIDPSNVPQVLWALATRAEPEETDTVRGCWGSALDPRLPPEKRQRGDFGHSVGIIFACKPYHWISQFPRSIKISPELLERTKAKWGETFSGKRDTN